MGIEEIQIPEVPIPVRILEEKRAAERRAKRALARNTRNQKSPSNTNRSVRKAS